ncbi:MAG: FIST N-terminal domain-containing protein [Syntrophomonadaceae bacterium]|nr:FIST N-terminal domain-containing protein [Syntrophomonadaceae bacterium]MDD3022723.1 FIST N-terminal domain-containing protein [Syntrophomonadaceae bacterium]
MNIQSVYSEKSNVDEAVREIQKQLQDFNTKMLIFFASSNYDPELINAALRESFGSIIIFGCTTAGEIISGRMLKNSLVAMAFNAEAIADVKVEIVENVKSDCDITNAFSSFEKHFNISMAELDYNQYVGIILVDGLSGCEEKIMDRIGDKTNITFIGGSAGDDLKFTKTYVYANGIACSDAAILAVIKPTAGFDIIKTQSFKALNKQLLATKVNVEAREIIEFNNLPAVKAYADALGVRSEDAANYFMSNPVGLIYGNEIYVRSPQRIDGSNMIFYCNILEGMDVSILESTDIVNDTRLALANKLEELGKISGIINFHCILRTLELEQKSQTNEYGKVFEAIPTIGFSTYGEEYIGHINQTSTILVFK